MSEQYDAMHGAIVPSWEVEARLRKHVLHDRQRLWALMAFPAATYREIDLGEEVLDLSEVECTELDLSPKGWDYV